ncbi:MAG: hypothetical protein ACK5LO_17460 [Leucobacter sp.]
MPVKFTSIFSEAGINISDPKYGLWWNKTKGLKNNHQSLARRYNKQWENWFTKNPEATKEQMLNQRKKMVRIYKPYYRC